MFRFLVLLASITIAAITMTDFASAQMVEIDFPELTGDYETGWLPPETGSTYRTTTFTFPASTPNLVELRLSLSGAWAEGLISCSNPYGDSPDTSSFTPGLSMYLMVPDVPGDFFHATIEPPDGTFSEWTATFASCCPNGAMDPNQLLGAEVTVEFFSDLMLILPCGVIADSIGSLTQVRIQAFWPVSVERSSWGAVKSLYR